MCCCLNFYSSAAPDFMCIVRFKTCAVFSVLWTKRILFYTVRFMYELKNFIHRDHFLGERENIAIIHFYIFTQATFSECVSIYNFNFS